MTVPDIRALRRRVLLAALLSLGAFLITAYVVACDNGEPGVNDAFSITLSNGYSASGSLGGSGPGGGNIQLHKCPPGWIK